MIFTTKIDALTVMLYPGLMGKVGFQINKFCISNAISLSKILPNNLVHLLLIPIIYILMLTAIRDKRKLLS